jgi:hypothetical protein
VTGVIHEHDLHATEVRRQTADVEQNIGDGGALVEDGHE